MSRAYLGNDTIVTIFSFLLAPDLVCARLVSRGILRRTTHDFHPRMYKYQLDKHRNWLLDSLLQIHVDVPFFCYSLLRECSGKLVQDKRAICEHILNRASCDGDIRIIRGVLESHDIQNLLTFENDADRSDTLKQLLHHACLGGHLQLTRYLHEQQGIALHEGCWMAVQQNHWAVTHYLHDNRCPWDSNSLPQAACYGHFGMVAWMIRSGYLTSEDECDDAIYRTRPPMTLPLAEEMRREGRVENPMAGRIVRLLQVWRSTLRIHRRINTFFTS